MSLHGRETDRDRIAADLRGGRSVVILGGAGIGKTELWRGLLEALHKQGTPVCRVVATATTRLIPGGVFAGLIAHAAPSRSASDRIVATLRALAAEGETAVICVDDAHLLDDESAAAILQHALSGGRLLLTARTGEPAPDAVRRFWKDGIASVWNVGPLDAEASAALVEEQVGAPVERLTQARLYAASGGNPLLLRELVEHGRVTGALCDLGGVWSWKGDLEAPPNVAAVIRERLIGIDPAVREVAELLAVGGPLPRVLFERLVVGPAFAAARRAGILRDRAHGPGEVLDLAHPLYAPVLIESLPAERERALLERLVAVAEPLAAGDRDLEVLLAAWFVRLADRSHPELLVAAAQRAFQRGELALAAPLARAAVAAGGESLPTGSWPASRRSSASPRLRQRRSRRPRTSARSSSPRWRARTDSWSGSELARPHSSRSPMRSGASAARIGSKPPLTHSASACTRASRSRRCSESSSPCSPKRRRER